ncbi:unnamed protein product, partial [Amoebophrya sp. A25]|eukprot:GSA25T00003769001.1
MSAFVLRVLRNYAAPVIDPEDVSVNDINVIPKPKMPTSVNDINVRRDLSLLDRVELIFARQVQLLEDLEDRRRDRK